MRKKLIFTLNTTLFVLGACTGCRSKEIPPKEFVHVPVYVAARTLPPDDQAKVRSNPVMRAYAVGRYVDPNRRTVMHEQHTVYREEQSPRWNLIPQPDADPVLMAQQVKRERYANSVTGQLAAASNDMRETKKLVQTVLKSQSGQETKTKELVQHMDELKKHYGIVSGNLRRSSEYINKLESELGKLQKEMEILKFQLRRKGN